MDNCVFDLPFWNFDAQCQPVFVLEARIEGDRIRVGGPGTDWTVQTDLGSGLRTVTFHDVQADGVVVIEQGRVVGMRPESLMGGAVRVRDALELLDDMAPGGDEVEVFAGYTKGFIRNLLVNILVPDIDTNGDGQADAVSFGLLHSAITGTWGEYRKYCATALDCDDGNPCTYDGCTVGTGCYHNPITASCDDGDPATRNDTCVQGACIGTIPDCSPWMPEGDLVAVNGFSLGQSGFPGQGLDIDGRPETCAPTQSGLGESPWCSDGIDNEVSVAEALANSVAQQLLQDFTWGTFLLDFSRYDGTEEPFDLPVFVGVARQQDGPCNFQEETCSYDLPYWNFTPSCSPDAVLPNARIVGDRLTAGGPGTQYTFRTWVHGPVSFSVHDLQVDGRIVRRGDRIAGLAGDSLAGGALRVADALMLLDQGFPGPDSQEVHSGLTKGFIRDLLTNLLEPDVDVNGDGVPEAISFGALFSALTARVESVRVDCRTDADCDDGNPCTYDGCTVGAGCFHNWQDGACDDGNPLTLLDVCVRGTCEGRIPDCGNLVTFGDIVAANTIALGTSGFPGQGLDLDGNSATCAPAANGMGDSPWCSDGIDNMASVVEPLVNPRLAELLAGVTDSTVLADFVHFRADGEPFHLPLYIGIRDRNIPCDFHRDNCTFLVPWWNFDGLCTPLWGFDNARVVGDVLFAGGPGYDMPLSMFYQGETHEATLYDVRLQTQLTVVGGQVVGIGTGSLVGGALRRSDGLKLLDHLFPGPDSQEIYSGLSKGFVRDLMTNVVQTDIDTDGDGTPDAWSLGLRTSALAAGVGGVMARCGSSLPVCDDGNPCTGDLCDPEEGCRHRFRDGACDDGLPWTFDDRCVQGLCSGTVPDCSLSMHLSDATRLDTLVPGIAGIPGEGLDVDDDPLTCSPTLSQGASVSCSGGIDNMLSLVEPLLGPLVADELHQFDRLTVLGDCSFLVDGGIPFPLPLYHGQKIDPLCDPDTETCDWAIPRYSLDDQCAPLYRFEDARYEGGVLTAGSRLHRIRVVGELDGHPWTVTVHAPRLRAEVPPGPVGAIGGIFAGAVRMADLEALLDMMFPGPDSVLIYGTYSKGYVKDVLRYVLVMDVDTDGDQVPDAFSFGVRFQNTDARVP